MSKGRGRKKESRTEIQRLYDALERVHRVKDLLRGKGFDDFKNDEMLHDAVLRNMEILGEATIYIPQVTKSLYNGIDWDALTKMRHVLAHGYHSINPLYIWNTYKFNFSAIETELNSILTTRLNDEETKKKAKEEKK